MVLFPRYKVPDGFTKPGNRWWQRVGSDHASKGRVLCIQVGPSYRHGILWYALDEKDDPNDGNGIGKWSVKLKTVLSVPSILSAIIISLTKNTDYPISREARTKNL